MKIQKYFELKNFYKFKELIQNKNQVFRLQIKKVSN